MTDVAKPTGKVTLTIDGQQVTVPEGTLLIRAAEQVGVEIPRFCEHPLLPPVGACRQCLVEVAGQRKPVTSCTTPATEGMVVRTHRTSDVARRAQQGIMEFLLINHPLDCPVCDKGGECLLQDQAMSTGRTESRFYHRKRTYQKPISLSTQVLLDQERCVQCTRCTRFSELIAGDPLIGLFDRSAAERVDRYRVELFGGSPTELGDDPFQSYFSGNTIQLCPVGALTSVQYRFQARPFDLVSHPSVCEHCAAGCAQRTDHRRGTVRRRLAAHDPAVNEEWDCDKGRFTFRYAVTAGRLTTPLVRDRATGELREAGWSDALATAADGLRLARDDGYGIGVLPGGRSTLEDAYAYSKFARLVLRTNNIDFRARPISAEETDFLATQVVGAEVSYASLERAPVVVLAGLEPEEECPMLFLRLRKAYRNGTLAVHALAPYRSPGLVKLGATLVPTVPGTEGRALAEEPIHAALARPGAVLLVGERLATAPGALSAAVAVAGRTGAALAWVPRRAGERGALAAGCLPHLLPGGRLVREPAARAELAGVWDLPAGVLDSRPGRDTDGIIAAAVDGKLGALLVGAVDPDDLADPDRARRALARVPFLVSLEIRASAVTRQADVVLPVAPVMEKDGSFLNWEGRLRSFHRTVSTGAMPDSRVLDALAARLGTKLNCAETAAIQAELAGLPATAAPAPVAPTAAPGEPAPLAAGQAWLATWHQLIDCGSLVAEEEYLPGTARPSVARISAELADRLQVVDGDLVTVSTVAGSVSLPAKITEMPDQVVWLPTNSPGSAVRRTLRVRPGTPVDIRAGGGEK